MALEKHFDLVYKSPDGFQYLLPKTVAQQVMIQGGQNMLDHINDNRHLYTSERLALLKTNEAGGYLKLDENGWVPVDMIQDSLIAIRVEFNDITDMVTNGSDIHPGSLVMVMDASADPNIKSGWGIYRRKMTPEYYDFQLGWELVLSDSSIDLRIEWGYVPGSPESSAADIDQMVNNTHMHSDLATLDKFSEDVSGHLVFDGKPIAFDSEVVRFYDTPFIDETIRVGDFWLKQSYGQSWWSDVSVEYAGTSCYEKYREYDTMITSPKLRTQDVTSMCRMFYKDYDLEEVQQYDTRKVQDFTGMYAECDSLKSVPCMWTLAGTQFDNMFYKASRLEYSPEMQLNNALSVVGMYSGCEMLEYVLPFGSTANVSNMRQWFNGCSSLKKIYTPIDFTSITSDDAVVGMFNECIDLEDVEFVDNTLKVSISLANTNLSKECILGILQGLPVIESEKTLTLIDIPEVSTLTAEDFAEAESKGWTILR